MYDIIVICKIDVLRLLRLKTLGKNDSEGSPSNNKQVGRGTNIPGTCSYNQICQNYCRIGVLV